IVGWPAVPRRDHDMPDFAGVTEGAAQRPAFMDHAQPESDAEIEVAEVADLPSRAVEPFADRRGRCVVVEGYGLARRFLKKRDGVDAGPAAQRGGSDGRHALDLEGPRHNHTYAEQARSLRTEPPAQRANLAGYVLRYVFGIGALQRRRGTRSQPSRK